MYSILFTESYQKKAKKFLDKHPEITNQYVKALKLLSINVDHPSLRLHKLSGRFTGLSSISINLSYRIIIHFIIKNNQIVLIDVGSHDEVY